MKLILISFVFPYLVWCFNLDPKFPVIIRDPVNEDLDNYFGYAVQFYNRSDSIRLLIGAPKSYNPDFSGAVYDCYFSDGEVKNCSQIKLYQNGTSEENVGRFSDRENSTDIWIGGALTVNEETKLIAVCGAQKNMTHLLNGICYILPYGDERDHEEIYNTVSVLHTENKKLYSFNTSQHRVLIPFYSLRESKISVQSFDNEIIIGAPGMFYRNGTLKNHTKEPFGKGFTVSEFYFTEDSSLGGYFGYSVAGGNFFKNQGKSYVAPVSFIRKSTGKVFVFKMVKEKEERVPLIQAELEGEKHGDYFGYALCVVDLNKDGYDDILVGAPGYSEDDTNENPTIEGKVYVFLSDGTGNFQKMDCLVGSNISWANFGFAISSVGDLDYDGFPEIAVGAPHERDSSLGDNTGCIYIYKGGVNGVSTKHIQRIRSQDVGKGIKGFGISISKGLDIDGNNYNDISVGAYESGHVILIKSKPVVNVNYSLEISDPFTRRRYMFNPYNSDASIFNPIILQDSTMFELTVCLKYEGFHVPERLDFDIEVTVDNKLQRASLMMSTGEKNSTSSYTKEILEKGSPHCLPFFKVFLNFSNYENNSLQYSPLPITLNYSIAENPSTEFCATCPVINQTSYHLHKILFKKPKCDNATLFPDWRITAEFPGIEEPFVVGSMDSTHLKVKVVNSGVWCTLKNLTIALPQNISLKSALAECYNVSENSLKCLGDAEVYSQKEIILDLELDLRNLEFGSGSVQFKFSLFSYFEDASQKNKITFQLNLKLKEKRILELAGKANPSVYMKTLEWTTNVAFTHDYEIFVKSGFTKIKIFYFRCEIQEKVLWKNSTLTLLESHRLKASTDSGCVSCGKRDVASAGKMDAFQSLSVKDNILINDTNIKDTNFYHTYDCFAYNLEPNSGGIHVQIEIRILPEVLGLIFENSSVIYYNTSVKVFHIEKFEKSVNTRLDRASIYSNRWLYYFFGVAIIVVATIIFVPVVFCSKRRFCDKRPKTKQK